MSKSSLYIKKLVLIALLGASLNAFKFVLMYIPNIEVVTLLIVTYTYVFGLGTGFFATMLFCTLEGFLWGFNPTWLSAYYIHWGLLSLVTYLLKLLKIKNAIIVAFVTALVTALFGLQSTFMYYLFGGGIGKSGWIDRYMATYISGALFYITQTVSNFVILLLAFKPICYFLEKMKSKYYYGEVRV